MVERYPILARFDEEQGIETPLNLMAGLGEALRVTVFDDESLVIKGFSALFCPLLRTQKSIQWHLLFRKDKSRISYLVANECFPAPLKIWDLSVELLSRERNFLV